MRGVGAGRGQRSRDREGLDIGARQCDVAVEPVADDVLLPHQPPCVKVIQNWRHRRQDVGVPSVGIDRHQALGPHAVQGLDHSAAMLVSQRHDIAHASHR